LVVKASDRCDFSLDRQRHVDNEGAGVGGEGAAPRRSGLRARDRVSSAYLHRRILVEA